MSIKENDYNYLKNLRKLFPNASSCDLTDLIFQVQKMLPFSSDKEKIKKIVEVFTYLDGIINGDDIRSYTTYQYLSKFAKQGIEELASLMQSEYLTRYREEKSSLENAIVKLKRQLSVLRQTGLTLETSNATLQKENKVLNFRRTQLKADVDSLDCELQDKKENGIHQLYMAISFEREKLNSDIESLRKDRDILRASIEELKQIINSYDKIIESMLVPQNQGVVWSPISQDSPIYNLNKDSIDAYINSLKLRYCDCIGLSFEACEKEFKKNCPELQAFATTLKQFSNPNAPISSVREIIEYKYWDESAYSYVNQLKALLKNIKLPVYTKLDKNEMDGMYSKSTLSSNLEYMLREIHFKKIAAEAVSKQKILEREIDLLIGLLNQYLPNGLTYEELTLSINKPTDLSETDEINIPR